MAGGRHGHGMLCVNRPLIRINSHYRVVYANTTNNATETSNRQLSYKIITLYNPRSIHLPTSGRNHRQVFLWYLKGHKMESRWEQANEKCKLSGLQGRNWLGVVFRVVGRCRFSNGYRRLEWTICLHHQVSRITLGEASSSVTLSHISKLTTKSENEKLCRNEPASGRKEQTWPWGVFDYVIFGTRQVWQ
jgi:hypothetical protein